MPPQRTTLPAKPVKTERTHEENQERAYIAASRRSDRSLEARVESARRASEIHKRRTGRALRVTEQDVINEEMYEEEDDPLPFQYRRLTAHLQTGSADFNRRLAAYLTNHIAMRTALDQAIASSYAQQYPNAPRPPPRQPSMFPSPMLPPTAPAAATTPVPTPPPPTVQSPATAAPSPYRQSPYPVPGTPAFRRMSHVRSSSVAHEDDPAGARASVAGEPRRASMAVGAETTGVTPAAIETRPTSTRPEPPLATDPSPSSNFWAGTSDPLFDTRAVPSQVTPSPFDPNFFYGDLGPLSMALPAESQMLLGPALDPTDPLTSMFMAGSESFPQPSWPGQDLARATDGRKELKPQHLHPSYDGVYATLAPSALQLPAETAVQTTPSGGVDLSATTTATPSFQLRDDPPFKASSASGYSLEGGPCGLTGVGGIGSPSEGGDWGQFINDILWE